MFIEEDGTTTDSVSGPSGPATGKPKAGGGGGGRVLYSAVVVDFISNPAEDLEASLEVGDDTGMTLRESLTEGLGIVKNTDLIPKMPRNSVVAWIASDRAAHGEKPEIFYPFFPPHLSFPVKPGEQVWVIYESAGSRDTVGYWIARRSYSIDVDDINYTHGDRDTLNLSATQSTESDPVQAVDGTAPEEYDPLEFPSGGGRQASGNTLPGEEAYEKIVEGSPSYTKQFTPEPVPRFSKRSPDFVIQGSNNTLICLGENRITPAAADVGTSPTDPAINGKGTIDIVAGRSMMIDSESTPPKTLFTLTGEIGDPSTAKEVTGATGLTLPSAIGKNTREFGEIDKTPTVTKSTTKANVNEGDPDFMNDLSRMYVSMKTNPDEAFTLEYSFATTTAGDKSPAMVDIPAIITKSDEIRIVARKKGSIRLVKEKEAALCEISLLPDDSVAIDGAKIFIGNNGMVDGGLEGQPIVRGEKLATAFATWAVAFGAGVDNSKGSLTTPILDGGMASACTALATAVAESLSEFVFVK
tara:strand:- start:10234 stop:11811 length:1578 start_codon:yes stop_codon:yes gene_type:complete